MSPVEGVMAENEALKHELEQARAQLLLCDQMIDWLRQKLFGNGKSESIDRAQMLLQLKELEAAKVLAQIPPSRVSYERPAIRKSAREPSAERFAHLPVLETVEVIPPEVEADPELYERIGEEITEEIDIRPPLLFKRRTIRPKFRHRLERSRPPVLAAAPRRPVGGGYASAGLLAWIVTSKYLDHLPLYRQEAIFARQGVKLPRQSMADWVEVVADWLKPIYNLMRSNLLKGHYLQADETPVRFLDADKKKGKAFTGQLWLIGRPNDYVCFRWDKRRTSEAAAAMLKGFKGLLQTDGYASYESFAAAQGDTVKRAGCWAHARRKFFEAAKEAPVAVNLVLRLIGHLYKYERQWKQRKVGPRLRAALRESHYGQTLTLLGKVARNLQARKRPSSRLGAACSYLLNQWPCLKAAIDNGHCELDNNLIENAVRPSALGKKNWLFIGSPDAGERTAVIYSVLISCRRFEVEPLAYLRDVLSRLPAMTNQDNLEDLLPDRWKALSKA